jgi:hypothetical protein
MGHRFEALAFVRNYRAEFIECGNRVGDAHIGCDGGAVWAERRFEEDIERMSSIERAWARGAAASERWQYGADMLREPNIRPAYSHHTS